MLSKLKNSLFVTVSSLVIATLSMNVSAQQTVVGSIPAEFSVNNGTASYTIPIEVTPGRAGMQPKLSLSYSSMGANGLLGVGWGLGGVSAIHRCEQTLAQDNNISGVNFDSDDRYCLDGQRLIPVNGPNGGIDVEYKTEVDNYSQVRSVGGSTNNPEYWIVKTKAGHVMRFERRYGLPGKGNLKWSVSEINDTTSENAISYEYSFNSSRNILRRINYEGGQVVLGYHFDIGEETRPDVNFSYSSGIGSFGTALLKNISIFAVNDGNSVKTREYKIDYQNTGVGQLSKIDGITLCNNRNECYEQLDFSWESSEISYDQNLTANNLDLGQAAGRQWVDFNGDGLIDFCRPTGSSSNQRVSCTLSTGANFGTTITANINWGQEAGRSWVDFNGDGFPDYCRLTSSNRLTCDLSNGSSFYETVTSNVINGGDQNYRWWIDFNGDGLPDFCRRIGQNMTCTFSGETGFTSTISQSLNWGDESPYNDVGGWTDINGDGLSDFCRVTGWGLSAGIRCQLSSGMSFGGEVFTPTNPGLTEAQAWSDVNGDGLADYCSAYASDLGHPDRVSCSLSTKDGLGISFYSEEIDWGYDDSQWWVDFNGDGMEDFCRRLQGSHQISCLLSDGLGFGEDIIIVDASDSTAKGRAWPDINGDGVSDYCELTGANSSGNIHCTLSTADAQSKISGITDSNGNSILLTYKTLTDPSVYTKGTGAQFPVQDLQVPQYVVSTVDTSNGVGGTTTVEYQYEGLRAHVQGRGLYGYSRITEFYPGTNKKLITTYDQRDFPYTGNILSVEEQYNDERINFLENTFDDIQHPEGYYQVYLSRSEQTSYELGNENIFITQITTTYRDVDEYGNIGRIELATTDGSQTFTKITESNYIYDDPTNWIIGRLSDTTVTHQSPYDSDDVRRTAFTYYSDTGLLRTEAVIGESGPLITTTHTYNSYGQKTEVRVTANNNEPAYPDRISTTHYDPGAVKPFQSCNALNQCETYTYTEEGWLETTTGPNGITTTWTYDGFGRKEREDRADGTWSRTQREFASSGLCRELATPFGANSVYSCSISESSGTPPVIMQYDALGRELRTIKRGFDGRLIFNDTEYNHLSQLTRTSREYYEGNQIYWATSEYDALDRVIRMTEPGPHGSTNEITYDYNGLSTTAHSGPEQRAKTTINNAIGQKVRIEEEENTYVEYTYNSDGNLLTTQVAGDADTTITLYYDEFGRKERMDDPDMGEWEYTYTPFGELETQTDAKGQVVTMEYDALGRMVERIEPEGTSTWDYHGNNAPQGSIGKLYQESGNGLTKTYTYDSLGRPESTTTTIAGEGTFTTELSYDSLGRVQRTTYPGTQGFFTENRYNEHGFLEAVTGLRSQAEAHDYSSLVPLITEATTLAGEYIDKANELRDLGQYYQSQIEYYQSLSGSGAVNSELQTELNQHQTHLNATVAQGQSVGIRTEIAQFIPIMMDGVLIPIIHQQQNIILQPELLSHINNAIIELQSVTSLINTQVQSYESIAEQLVVLAAQTLAAADHNFQFATTLDNSASAYNELIVESSTSTITYWRAVDVDASGRISAEVYGNGIVNDYAYNQATGQLQSIHSSLLAVDAIRHTEYQYDAYQNVTLRDDLVNDIRDTFDYDRLDRLTTNQVSSSLYAGEDFNKTQSISYDALGNIRNKSDVGTYTYGSRPHAVTQAGSNSYQYDANGNMETGDGRTIQWNSFNKPTQITRNGNSATFSYGPGRERFKKTNHIGDTTVYVGSLYERLTKNSGQVDQKHYIYAAGQLVAEHILSTSEGTQTRYLHKDALGSVDLVTDAYANVVDRRSFDAWGKSRNLPWQSQAGLDDLLYLTQLPFTNKGYTGHEHVQEVALIHMNGRMYDAILARFISADPHVQAGTMSQSYNRYSYVLNNPMKYTDPSGYFFKKAFNKLKNHAKKYNLAQSLKNNATKKYHKFRAEQERFLRRKWVQQAGYVAASFCGAFYALCVAGHEAAIADAYGADIYTAAEAGFRAGVTAYVTQSVSSYIGGQDWTRFGKAVAHGVVGGTVSVINGGKFGQGFASSFFTKMVSGDIKNATDGNRFTGAIGAALVGGTASELGGGKFANGAATAAMQYLFNEVGKKQQNGKPQQCGPGPVECIANGTGGATAPSDHPRWPGQNYTEDGDKIALYSCSNGGGSCSFYAPSSGENVHGAVLGSTYDPLNGGTAINAYDVRPFTVDSSPKFLERTFGIQPSEFIQELRKYQKTK